MFRSGFLEFFTHIHPAVVLAVWLPVVGFLVFLSVRHVDATLPPWGIPLLMLLGITFWAFVEYTLHRFLFHYPAKSERGKRIAFMFHGLHHAQPMLKTRLLMPPPVSLGIGAVLFGFMTLIVGVALGRQSWVYPLYAGTALGYLWYDLTHYAIHHLKLRGRLFQFLRRHHLHHHGSTPDMRFGVSSPVLDYVFGTEPRDDRSEQRAAGA